MDDDDIDDDMTSSAKADLGDGVATCMITGCWAGRGLRSVMRVFCLSLYSIKLTRTKSPSSTLTISES